MSKYFDRFPLVDYNGTIAKNILARVDFTDETKKAIYSNFQFTLQEGFERPDLVSYNVYDSSQYDWLIYLSNNIVDPYYDYYRPQAEFKNYIISKYGSVASAQSLVQFYRNNWHQDERILTTTEYEALQSNENVNLRKYWKPRLSNIGAIVGYERVQEDWVVSTNKIVELTTSVSPVGISVGSALKQSSTNARGFVDFVDTDNNKITLKHISGTFTANTTEGITAVTTIAQNISNDEADYWSPVTAYDDEEEKNELKKSISVIKSSYLSDVEKLFKKKIKS